MRGDRDLKVYQLAYKLAMEIFNKSKSFPKEERYSLSGPDSTLFTQCCHQHSRGISKTKISKYVYK